MKAARRSARTTQAGHAGLAALGFDADFQHAHFAIEGPQTTQHVGGAFPAGRTVFSNAFRHLGT